MWFNKVSDSLNHAQIEHQLEALASDGVHLSIDELLYYQSKVSLIDLAPKKALTGQLAGNYLARTKGRGMEFDEVRHYQNGDDIRAIDWRVTARTGKTHTKLFREEVERPVLIATDFGNSMYFGSRLLFKSVQAAHIAALLAWHASKRGDRLGGLVFNQQQHLEVKPKSRQKGVLHYLHALEQMHQPEAMENRDTQYFYDNCLRLKQIARPGALVYLITDGYHFDNRAIKPLSQISKHCELVICHVFDPLETKLPRLAQKTSVAINNGESEQRLTLGDRKTATRYQQHAEQRYLDLQAQFRKANARCLSFSAGESLEQQLKSGVVPWIP
ncbi:DUF58 domain-containing protein [Thalassotalea mangrovi]|uniref:DUF58 domain-containing protein n=1 Tax=Thalassotalea mangrovi TaxID=2572245 RepID=A0A4U1B2Y4_9GAMM|nr:DUF58 domain-containing protein [Thalassotalea mangrovi]TKB44072.1 DUF58 domain-containing protein [Thalassotalea mangrovi]